MPNGGASQIFIDENYNIFNLYNTNGAFPSAVLINHEMMVYDKNPSLFILEDVIPELLEDCGSLCECNGISNGDINQDEIVNIQDIIITIQFILDAETTNECVPDINQDGIVDVADVIVLLNIILEE